jgi:histidinol-phosphate aminotransferase
VDIKRLVRPGVRALKPYGAKEIPCRVKLDANESPYRLRLKAPSVALNRYPDPEAVELRRILSRQLKVRSSGILVGNGSDEIIYYLATTFGGPVLYPEPTFVMYGVIARALGHKAIGIPLDREFDIDMDRTLEAVKKHRPKLMFLSTPNNPTGNCFSADRVLKLIESSGGIVVVDEAYQPFSSRRGFVPLLKDYENLVIMRTLSKVGLAALRVGFLIGSGEIIGELDKVRLPYNVNSYSQALACEALKDGARMQEHIAAIVAERERLNRGLMDIEGVSPYPNEANFILFKVARPDRVHSALLGKGVLIRNLNSVVKGCLRVTVGTRKENTAFLKALRAVMGKQ